MELIPQFLLFVWTLAQTQERTSIFNTKRKKKKEEYASILVFRYPELILNIKENM